MVVMTGFEKTGMELVYAIHGTSWHINFLLFSQRLSSSQTVRYGRHKYDNVTTWTKTNGALTLESWDLVGPGKLGAIWEFHC